MTVYPLNRWLLAAGAALLALACPDLRAAGTTATRTFAQAVYSLEIGGVDCGALQKCDGGDLRATVVVENDGASGGALPKKHITSPACAPLVLTVALPFNNVIADWINDLCANRPTLKTVRVYQYDYTMTMQGGFEAANTALVEVDFPAFDATDKSAASLTLVLQPGSTQPLPVGATQTVAYAAVATRKPVSVSTFTVAIDGLGTAYVSRIEPIVIKRPASGNSATEFTNLTASFGDSDAATWHTWFNDFVVNGNSGDAQEKSGTLSLADATGSVALALQFSHLGLLRLSPMPFDSTADALRSDQAELYFEGLTLGTNGVAGTSSTGSTTTTGSTTGGITQPTTGVPPTLTTSGTKQVPPTLQTGGASTTGTSATAAVITSPAPSSTLDGSTATFTWNAVPGATGYALVIGTATNNTSLFNQNVGLATSQVVSGLPTDGSYLYVRLWTAVGAATLSSDSNYKTFTSTAAVITSPATGSTLGGSTATFTWNAVPGATGYALVIGTATNNTDVFNKNLGLATSQTVTGIPTDGSYIYARLWTSVGGATLYSDYNYKTAGASTTGQTTGTTSTGTLNPTPPPTSRLPVSQPTTLIAPTAIAPTTMAAFVNPTSAGSQTSATIANFPALSAALRTSFSSSRSPSAWQERANYSVAVAPESAVSTYAPQLTAAGWAETSRSQSGDASTLTLQFVEDLMKGPTKAHLVYAQNQAQSTKVAVALTTQFPGGSSPALSSDVTAAPASGATSSPLDRGKQDPADFPRLPGSVRTAYTSALQRGSTQEIANYTAKCVPASAEAFFAQALPGAGWDQTARSEELNDATLADQITSKWQGATASAVLTIIGSTAGACSVRLILTTQMPAP